jgi:hypothetical protein
MVVPKFDDGRRQDVFFEDVFYSGIFGGEKTLDEKRLYVWADAGMLEAIKKVSGVAEASRTDFKTCYSVYFDPRYDREIVKKEIVSVILCTTTKEEKKDADVPAVKVV